MEANLQSFHKIDPFELSIGYTLFTTFCSISPLWSIIGESISIVWLDVMACISQGRDAFL